MPKEIKHTPLPWQYSNGTGVYNADGMLIARCEAAYCDSYEQAQINAGLIVKAVNNHYKLLGILKDIISNCAIKSERIEKAETLIKEIEGN